MPAFHVLKASSARYFRSLSDAVQSGLLYAASFCLSVFAPLRWIKSKIANQSKRVVELHPLLGERAGVREVVAPPARAVIILLCTCALSAPAATNTVSSISELNTRIASAVAGDVIIVTNGIYSSSSAINITRTGTAAKPITIMAQTIGGVEITGAKGFTLSSPAAYITIQGFKFTHTNNISISTGTSHCRFTRNIIQLSIPFQTNDISYINISGDDVEIDHNELRNKFSLGEMLDISGSGSQVARRLWVHHNYFHDFDSPGGNGAETIRWGLSGLSLSTGDGLCEYNLFVHCEGENEMISNKSSGNTYRYNSVINCIGGEVSQRHGNDCLYYGNYIRNSQGIRVFGDRHKIFNNYFESNSVGISMGNGDGDVYNGALLTAHDRPDDNTVVFNTFAYNGTHYEMAGRTGGLGSSNSVVANNIFLGGGNMASISSSAPYTGTWSNNIRWQTSTAGNMPASGYTNVNPLLARDAKSILHLQAGSPAINTGVGSYDAYGVFSSYPYATNDMDGQLRDATKDIGADEFSGAPITITILTTNDVGPFSGLTNQPPPPPEPPSLTFEAELIPFTTNGATAAVQNDVNSSNGQWEALTATTNGAWIEYTLANVPAGEYQLSFKWKGNTSNRGIITHSVDGVSLGDSVDLYSSAQTYPETNLTVITFTNTGTHTVRQTVIGKNPAGTGDRWAAADKFTLTLVQSLPSTFTGVLSLTNGSIQLNGTGYPTLNYRVQVSTNLGSTNWTTLGTITADSNGSVFFTDTNAVAQPSRFYRLVTP
jgi:poly(beta-D-mannuronate) lyase